MEIIQSAPAGIPAILGWVADLCDSWVGRTIPAIIRLAIEALRKRRWPHSIRATIDIGIDQFTHTGVEVAVKKALCRFGGWLAKRWLALAFGAQPIVVVAICVGLSITLAMLT